MLKHIYNIFQYNLKSLKDSTNEQLFKIIDRWKNQSRNFNKSREILLPGAFIEIKSIDNIKKLGQYMTTNNVNVDIHIVTERYSGSESGDVGQNESLDLYKMVDMVGHLHGIAMEDQSKLQLNQLYYPTSGQTIDGIVYDYSDYLVGPVNLVGIKNVTGSNDDVDEYIISFNCIVSDSYNMPHYTYYTGITYALSGVTF